MNFGMDYQGDTGGGGGQFGGGDTSYGGGGGGQFGGGGGQFGGGGGGSQPGKARKSYDEQKLIPVTCRMVLNTQSASNAEGTGSLQLPDGRELYQVRLVGAVRTVDDLSTHVTYTIEDGTGLVEVKQWLDDNDCTAVAEMRQECLKENIYVKIVGQVKDYADKKTVVAYSVRKLSSGNEITHHMLEVVYSAERFKRNESIVAPPSNMMGSTGGGVGFGAAAPQGGGVPVTAAGSGGSGNDLNDAVLNYIKVEGDKIEVGAPVHGCIQALTAGGRYNESQIRQAIDSLASEGHIYSTINEDNYKFAI